MTKNKPVREHYPYRLYQDNHVRDYPLRGWKARCETRQLTTRGCTVADVSLTVDEDFPDSCSLQLVLEEAVAPRNIKTAYVVNLQERGVIEPFLFDAGVHIYSSVPKTLAELKQTKLIVMISEYHPEETAILFKNPLAVPPRDNYSRAA